MLRPQHGAARSGEKACLDEQRHRLGLGDRAAVEPLHGQALGMALTHPIREGLERRTQPVLVGLAQGHERAAAALDVERRHAAEQDDVSAGDAGRPRTRPSRPRQRRAVGLSGICRGEHERIVLDPTPELPQPFHRTGERELRPAEPFHEVSTPTGAKGLERAQLAVDGAVAAGDALAADPVAHDDALALEQQLREGAPVDGGREQPCRQRPATLG